MQIDNGITDRERAEVLAAINEMYDDTTKAIKKATGESEYIYAQGKRYMIERVRDYLRKRWQT